MNTEAWPPPPAFLTMEEVLARGRKNHQRLIRAGRSPIRDNEQRLAWKRSRGIDTRVEERCLGISRDAG